MAPPIHVFVSSRFGIFNLRVNYFYYYLVIVAPVLSLFWPFSVTEILIHKLTVRNEHPRTIRVLEEVFFRQVFIAYILHNLRFSQFID